MHQGTKKLGETLRDSDARLVEARHYLETLFIGGGTAIERGNTHSAITEGGNLCFTYFASREFASHGTDGTQALPRLYMQHHCRACRATKWTKECGMTSSTKNLKDSKIGRKMEDHWRGSYMVCMARLPSDFNCAGLFGASCGVTRGACEMLVMMKS